MTSSADEARAKWEAAIDVAVEASMAVRRAEQEHQRAQEVVNKMWDALKLELDGVGEEAG